MIFALTPNPALDLSGVVDHLIPDEKNYVQEELRCPGGNAINVSRLLTRLKVPVTAIGFLGQSVGSEIRTLLDKEKVKHKFVEIAGNTRISVTVLNLKSNHQTRLSFHGPQIQAIENKKLKEQVQKIPQSSILIIGGSFPPGFTTFHANNLIRSTKLRGIPIIVDVPGKLMTKIDVSELLLIKPNLSEFQDYVGSKVKSISAVAQLARSLAINVGLVCVSSVEGGALLVSRDFAWFGIIPKIKVKTTVGAGDSMIAGMSAVLWKKKITIKNCNNDDLIPELLRHGLAAAAATLITSGSELGEVITIKNFVKKISIRKIIF